MLINTYLFKDVKINKEDKTAILGSGLNLGQAYTLLDKEGFTIPGGTCPTVGLAGLTLGGGKGILTRLHGLLIDKLIGVHAVLNNGTYVEADATQYPDLLWIAQGGGGNSFPGIVLAFQFKLVSSPMVITEWSAKWRIDVEGLMCDGEIHCAGVEAFQVWQNDYVVHPNRNLYVRLEIHPYSEPYTYPEGTDHAGETIHDPPFVAMSFKFVGMMQDEAKQYVWPAISALGFPFNGNHSVDHTGGDWVTHNYIKTVQVGGGIGMDAQGGACKTWDQGMNLADADEEMLRAVPHFCSWDGGFTTNMLYRAIVMGRLSVTGIQHLMNLVLQAPVFDDAGHAPGNFYLEIDPSNGAAADVAPTATAYPWRGTDQCTMQVVAKWPETDTDTGATMKAFNYLLISALQPYTGTRSYYNYADDDMPGGAIPLYSYFGPNSQRIIDIRAKYTDVRIAQGSLWELSPDRPNQSFGVQRW